MQARFCKILLEQTERDFHLVALRRNVVYQSIYLQIRRAKDTAILSQTAEIARRAKDEKRLSLKEYTALSTVAKSQFARLAGDAVQVRRYIASKKKSAAPIRAKSVISNGRCMAQIVRRIPFTSCRGKKFKRLGVRLKTANKF